jgi:hypothetical protein
MIMNPINRWPSKENIPEIRVKPELTPLQAISHCRELLRDFREQYIAK